MKNIRAGKIIFATSLSILIPLVNASAMQWPWQRETPKPAPTAAPAPATAPAPVTAPLPAQSGPSSPDDTARFLAGMPLPKVSSLASLTNDPAWQEHAANFEKAFAKMNMRQLLKLHNWEAQYLPESRDKIPVAFYMFSGPDFLYVDQFFPKADVYILCGKESMGPPPDPLRIANLGAALHNLEEEMQSSLRFSFFITKDMKTDLEHEELKGTLPIFYVFLGRAGKTITDVSFITLDKSGIPDLSSLSARSKAYTPGVRITFTSSEGGPKQTMFYFTTDLSNDGIRSQPGFMKFFMQASRSFRLTCSGIGTARG